MREIKFLKMKFIFVLWVVILLGLSYFSGYSITGSVADVNFEIATMLAPSGLIHNLWISADHYLKPYYSQGTLTENFIFQRPVILGLYSAFALVSLAGLSRLRRK